MTAAALTLQAFAALAAQCAPALAPEKLAAVAHVESGLRALALNVNGAGGGPRRASTMEEAVALAELSIAAGQSVDLGLMQVNSRHLPRFRLTVAQAMEPCRNVALGAWLLTDAERAAAACVYNTGRADCRRPSGTNGYPEKIRAAAARLAKTERPGPAPPQQRPEPRPEASWDVWAEPAPAPAPPPEPPDGEDDAAPSGRPPRVVVELN